MSLTLVGVNHRTAPIEVREQLTVPEAETAELVREFQSLPGTEGVTLLSTCNRIEAVFSSSNEDVAGDAASILASRSGLSRAELEKHLYVHRHADVVRHLFRLAAGLDSMIVGEPQIGGQVRGSYLGARALGALDPVLQRLYEQTLRVAKKIRTETGIGEHAVSVPFAAVELSRKIFGELRGLSLLLIGAGEMGEATAEHLEGSGVAKIVIANRSPERAERLAIRFGGQAVPFDSVPSLITDADIVIASTSSPVYLIAPEHIQEAMSSRTHRDLFLIDLSVPRNIDPAVSQTPGVYLYNVDDLQGVAEANRLKRTHKATLAEEIVDAEVQSFVSKLASQEVVPTIVELQDRLETLRRDELDKCLRRLGPITAEQRTAIEMLTSGIINKILHYPMVRLKESAAEHPADEPDSMREAIRKIFGLR